LVSQNQIFIGSESEMTPIIAPPRTRGLDLEKEVAFAAFDQYFQVFGKLPSARKAVKAIGYGAKSTVLRFLNEWYQERTGESVYAVSAAERPARKILAELDAAITATETAQIEKLAMLAEDVEDLLEECEQLNVECNEAREKLDEAHKRASQCDVELEASRRTCQAMIDLFAPTVAVRPESRQVVAPVHCAPTAEALPRGIESEFGQLASRVDQIAHWMQAALSAILNNGPIEQRLELLRKAAEAANAAIAPQHGTSS
jgi:hypothetical protein